MILCASFNLPFRFVDPGNYNVPYTWLKRRYIRVQIKLEQNFTKSEKIGGIGIQTSDGGSVDLSTDEHGIINYTKVLIEFEDESTSLSLDPCGNFDFLMQLSSTLKLACVQLLNKLGQIVRVTTNNFWIRSINLRDIFDFYVFDKNTGQFILNNDFGHGYYFPNLKTIEQSIVRTEIEEALSTDLPIPPWRELYLDAINYFTIGRYNEAVVIMNVALESFVADHLFQQLKKKPELAQKKRNPKDEVLDIFSHKFHKVMEKYFVTVDGRSFKNNGDLWTKFDVARNIRRDAVHSFTKRVSHEAAKKVLDDIMEIINWIGHS
jgi:hypothetical protein